MKTAGFLLSFLSKGRPLRGGEGMVQLPEQLLAVKGKKNLRKRKKYETLRSIGGGGYPDPKGFDH